MKKIILILLLITIKVNAQDRDNRFSIFSYTDPIATEKDGFNIGFGLDYQMNVMYFKAQIFTFPNLRGNTYTETTGSIGFNAHFGGIIEQPFRLYAGFKAGKISRASGHGGGTIGFEGGFDFTIPDTNIYIGLGGSHDLRTDGKAWGDNEHNYWRSSGLVKLGLRF